LTDFAYPYSLIPLVALASKTPLLVALLKHDGADPDVPGRAYGFAGPSGLRAPALPDAREERGSRVLEA
jgi:hypothetical protein